MNVTSSERTITRFEFTAKAYGSDGVAVKEVMDAVYMATKKAEQVGIKVAYDDWAHVIGDEEGITVYFEVKGPPENVVG